MRCLVMASCRTDAVAPGDLSENVSCLALNRRHHMSEGFPCLNRRPLDSAIAPANLKKLDFEKPIPICDLFIAQSIIWFSSVPLKTGLLPNLLPSVTFPVSRSLMIDFGTLYFAAAFLIESLLFLTSATAAEMAFFRILFRPWHYSDKINKKTLDWFKK